MVAIGNGTNRPYRISKTFSPQGMIYHLDSANLPSFDLELSATAPVASEELWRQVSAIVNEEAERRADDSRDAASSMRQRLAALGINVKVLM